MSPFQPMDLDAIKSELTQLVLSGRKAEAIKLLRDRYQVDEAEAEKLLRLAVKESVSPGMLLKTVGARFLNRGLIFKMIAFGLGFMGVPMALMFAGLLFFDHYNASNSHAAEGIVTGLETYSYSDPKTCPVISYTVDSETFSLKGSTYSSPPAFEVGDRVPLLVSHKNPGEAVIDTFSERWLGVTILGTLSTLLLGLMIFIIRLSRKRE